MNKERQSKILKTGAVLLAVLIVVDLVVHYKAAIHSPTVPIPVVRVQKPQRYPVTEYITQTGNTVAFNSVNLVARVQGYLDDITFVDGTFLKKGQPLFVIEPEPYLAKLRAAKAQLAALKAAALYAKTEYTRQQRMYKENATSLSNVQKWLARKDESYAQVDKAAEDVVLAEINYSYTHISAPFDGRIGRHLVDKGNLVGNGVATNLATIEQLDPIYVYFNLNELDFIKLRDIARQNKVDEKTIKQTPVFVRLQNGDEFQFEGKLDFINTSLDASTGTIELRALLPNKQLTLLPNLFVQVRVPLSKPVERLTVPETVILYDQIGAYVLTVNDSNHVVLKRVLLGSVDKGRRAILGGILAQDNVIIDGLQNATPGNEVSLLHEKI